MKNFKFEPKKKIIPGATIILMPSAESTVTPFSVPWIWKPDDKNPPFKRLHFKFVTVRSRSYLYFHKNAWKIIFGVKQKRVFALSLRWMINALVIVRWDIKRGNEFLKKFCFTEMKGSYYYHLKRYSFYSEIFSKIRYESNFNEMKNLGRQRHFPVRWYHR